MVEVKTGDLSKVTDAPEFRPSVEEWKNPIAYVEKIRLEAEAFGIAKIIPPAGWNPPFALKEDFKFSTRVQHIHRLQEAAGFEAGRRTRRPSTRRWPTTSRPPGSRSATRRPDRRYAQRRGDRAGVLAVVETAQPPTEVEYGNDITNTTSGGHAAFQPATDQLDASLYAGEPNWNLVLLPHAPGSVLKSLPNAIQGITEPWLYIGMLFATFGQHRSMGRGPRVRMVAQSLTWLCLDPV